jgi:competence ComEA-like helix-hairpin-helix protein
VETQNAAGRVLIPYPPGLSAARLTAGDLRGFTWRGPDPVDRSGRLIRRDADRWDLGPLSGDARLALGERLDIGTAQAGDLELLPDIGPALAARIVKFRDESGPLTRIEDLDRIPGMTRAALDRIRPLIQMEADASSQ